MDSHVCCLWCWADVPKWKTEQSRKSNQSPVSSQDSFQGSCHHPVLSPATTGDSSSCHLKNGCPMSPRNARHLCPWHAYLFPLSHNNGNSLSTGGLAQWYQSNTSTEPFQGDLRLESVQLILTQVYVFILYYFRLEACVDLEEEGRERLSRPFISTEVLQAWKNHILFCIFHSIPPYTDEICPNTVYAAKK